MTTTERRRGKFKSVGEIYAIPGYQKTLDTYTATLKRYLTEITLAFNEAPSNRGVPPVRSVMEKYESELSDLYDKLEQLAVEYDA